MKRSFYIAELIEKYIRQELSEQEKKVLETWRQESNGNKELFNEIVDPKSQLSKLEIYQLFNKDQVWTKLQKRLFEKRTVHLFSRKIMRYAAAILIPLMIMGGFSIFYFSKQTKFDNLAQVDDIIKPGSQKAILILSNGDRVDLSNENIELEEEGALIENRDSTLHYIAKRRRQKAKEVQYNELRTPIGGTYNLKLADGTEVWLNAGSVLRFPVEFSDTIRKVYLTGEGFFKVSHNGSPFLVNLNDANIEVLGTSFNVSAYSDDEFLKTTLVEGKIAFRLDSKNKSIQRNHILTPGLQAVVNRNENSIEINQVNTAAYTSWVNGKIEFNNEKLETVMKKLARWYEFEYTFEREQTKEFHFTARFDREDHISNILQMLELTTDVKFKLEKQTIVIL